MTDDNQIYRELGKQETIVGQHGEALSAHQSKLSDADKEIRRIDRAVSALREEYAVSRLNDRNGIIHDSDVRRDDAHKSFVSTQLPVIIGQSISASKLVHLEELPELIDSHLKNRKNEWKANWKANLGLALAFSGVLALVFSAWAWVVKTGNWIGVMNNE